jgi:phosphoglycolate phosphatase-like HAD superfamily hydrolase
MIARCIQKSAADLGLAVPSLEQASHVIGLGLADALAQAVPDLDVERTVEFSERYRFHYFACEPDIVLFEGVRELLDEQHQLGLALAGGHRQEPARTGTRVRGDRPGTVLCRVALCRRNALEAASGHAARTRR